MKLITDLYPAQRLGVSGAVPLFTLYALMVCIETSLTFQLGSWQWNGMEAEEIIDGEIFWCTI